MSVSGFGASVLAILKELSVVLGFMGALLGLLAGYYTWRIKREHWNRIRPHTVTTVVTTVKTDSQQSH